MPTALQVSFEGLEPSEAVETRVREEADKLEQFVSHMTSMRVVIARPQHRHQKGDHYQVRIQIVVPRGPDIVVSRDPAGNGAHEDVYVSIRDAFKSARRQLQDLAAKH